MDSITAQIRELYTAADEDQQRAIHVQLRDLQNDLSTEWDIVCRVGSGFLQMALIRIGHNLHIFETLASRGKEEEPLTLEHFAKETGADRGLLGHLLRATAAFGFIHEAGKDAFKSNRMTTILANENVSGAMDHGFDLHGRVALELPTYLTTHAYQPMTSNTDLPFHLAFDTPLAPFDWLRANPEQMKSLAHAMAISRPSQWFDVYPVASAIGGGAAVTPTTVAMVDVGGGFGHQAVGVRRKFPELAAARFVVQDLKETLDGMASDERRRLEDVEGVEFQMHDFFTEQPVQGAKIYYLRHVLHDWSDEECVRILKAIVPAMAEESRVVIDEVVLPDEGVPWQCAYMDVTMMACLGGGERTRSEFEGLLERAGLKITEVVRYDSKMLSVVIASLK
ncbi:S-adenosyl-L-methionine-dependent methyltransferase [Aaosphaeria arxii CBS 175.79]|uniref:S-adenosyl-L-methionine-dependent methyltransferase n=1 Tax=Aaosphaeria arxii CBS 175.79 TaxID=1450172 RepID=A0A6A5XU30_9PLEO|nr:S-adenosyl-L-methionine-dependent methyltransferase [Aaosphaeria arxii CBS 175.79]KAF2016221.1 S-adenosyl-L-methionine-dependent methyltransferase [Aaosphaeria arxii CBS 175.79]